MGVDGSESAAAALGWAGRLAHAVGAEVVIATVVEPHGADTEPEPFADLLRRVHEHLDGDWAAPIRASGAAYRTLVLTGPPTTLLHAAAQEGADLIVVGTRGHGGFADLHIGSLAHHLVHTTDRPLAIVPTAGANAPVDRLVVGVDGSKGSAVAVAWCADVASVGGTDVLAVHAFEPFAEWVPESDQRGWRRTAGREMDEWVASLRAAGAAVRTRIIQDVHPVAALAVAAAEDAAGMIVVGTRGADGALGFRLGRVPLQLVHHSHLPVILVPPAN